MATHAQATYQVVRSRMEGWRQNFDPRYHPTTVSSFDTIGAAEARIGEHKARVGAQSERRSVFRRGRR